MSAECSVAAARKRNVKRTYVMTPDIEAQIREQSQQRGDCLIWMGYVDRNDCPRIQIDRSGWMVRRFMLWEELFGNPFPLKIINTCGNPRCLTHLKAVTPREIQAKSPAVCPKGHPLTDKTVTWRLNGRRHERQCKVCRREQSKAYYRRAKELMAQRKAVYG